MKLKPDAARTPRLNALTGWLLITAVALAILTSLSDAVPGYLAGIPIWGSAVLVARSQSRKQLTQCSLLLAVGFAGLAIGSSHGIDQRHWLTALGANQLLMSMIVSVSFLRIAATGGISNCEQLPTGRNAIIKTLLGSHLVSSVINVSSVMIMADRLSYKKPLTTLQALTLLRAFSACAVWSPFFAAMGVILISAPGAQLSTLITFGIPSALTGLIFTLRQTSNHPDIGHTEGYPMHVNALWMPVLLAMLVIIEHSLWPRVSVITLVTLTSILFVITYLLITAPRSSTRILLTHIHHKLPTMGSEIILFLSAAVMAAGVSALLESFDIRLAPDIFGPGAAVATLLTVVTLAMVGMHPVTSTFLAGSVLMPSVTDPNLLGITLLMAWSIGVCVSPLSGVQLNLQARYGISAMELMKLNLGYTLLMLSLGAAVIWSYWALMM